MSVKRMALTVIFAVVSVLVYSESVAFQVIQHDKSSDDVRLSSLMIEETILDYFFNPFSIF